MYNKCDLQNCSIASDNGGKNVFISAKTGQGIADLMAAIADTAPGKKYERKLLIPYSDGGVLNELHKNEKVLDEEYRGDGVYIKVLADEAVFQTIKQYEINEG